MKSRIFGDEPLAGPAWTTRQVASILGMPFSGPDVPIRGFSMMEERVVPGDCYVGPLKAGPAQVEGARLRGAVLTVGRGDAYDLRVGDPEDAITALAEWARDRSGALRIALTGSIGKTSTTELLCAALAPHLSIRATQDGYNTPIPGFVQTFLRGRGGADALIFEVGINGPDQMAFNAGLIRPHVVVITAIGSAHVGRFGGDHRVLAREKATLMAGLAPGGWAILPEGGPHDDVLRAVAAEHGVRNILTFGRGEGADVRLMGSLGGRLTLRAFGQDLAIPLGFDEYVDVQEGNVAAAAAVCLLLHPDPRRFLADFAWYRPPQGRGTSYPITLASGARFRLIDDSYNASSESFTKAVRHLHQRYSGDKILLLGDMAHSTPQEHEAVAAEISRYFHKAVLPVGEVFARTLGLTRLSLDQAALGLEAAVGDGDVVLVKGSSIPEEARVGRLVPQILAMSADPLRRTGGEHVILDVASGAVLDASRPLAKVYPAGLTKLMALHALLLAVEEGGLSADEILRTPAELPPRFGPAAFPPGTPIPVWVAASLLALAQANDVSLTVANRLGGSAQAFVSQMNFRLLALGLHQTAFANPVGFHAAGHVSSPLDLARLGRRLLLDFPGWRAALTAPSVTVEGQVIPSRCALDGADRGLTGLMAGGTPDAGRHLMAIGEGAAGPAVVLVTGAPSSHAARRQVEALWAGWRRRAGARGGAS